MNETTPKRKKGIRKYFPWLVLGLIALLLALMPVMARKASAGAEATVLQATAQVGEVENTLAGGGVLTAEDPLEVQVPATVEITEFLVENGDRVEAGQPLAKVDRVTLLEAMLQVQQSLDKVAEQMTEEVDYTEVVTLSTKAPGRVKAVYAHLGDDAARVVMEHGALAVISLDGMMVTKIQTGLPVRAGDNLTVRTSDGKEYPGRVETALNGALSVTLTDNGPLLGETVTAYTLEGDEVGSGTLAAHSAWNVLTTEGTVTTVTIRENQQLRANDPLFQLKDLGSSSEYRKLAAKHRQYEQLMQDLFALYTDDTVKAQEAGFVSGIDKDMVKNTATDDSAKPVLKLLAMGADGTEASEAAEATVSVLVTNVIGDSATGILLSGDIDFSDIPSLLQLMANPEAATLFTTQSVTSWDASVRPLTPGMLILVDQLPAPQVIRRDEQTQAKFEAAINSAVNNIPIPGSFDPSGLPGGLDLSALLGGYGMSGYGLSGFDMTGEAPEDDGLYDLEQTTVMKLTPDRLMTVTIEVDELDILQYETGMRADVTVDALPNRSFTAEVEEIAAVGENSGGNSKYSVRLRLDRAPDMLDGMNASVIVHRGVTSGLLLPVEAVHDRGSHSYVYTALDNKTGKPTAEVPVVTGVSDGVQVEIIEGVAEGQPVFYEYYLPVEGDT